MDSETKVMLRGLGAHWWFSSVNHVPKCRWCPRTRSPNQMKQLSIMCSQLRKLRAGFRKVWRFRPQNTHQLGFLHIEPVAPSLELSTAASHWVVGVTWSYCFSSCWKILGEKDAPSEACVSCDLNLSFHSHVSLNVLWASGTNGDRKC